MRILYHYKIASKDGQLIHVEGLTTSLVEAGHELHILGPGVTGGGDVGSERRLFIFLRKYLPRPCYEMLEFGFGLLECVRLWLAARKFKPDFIYERYSLYMPGSCWVSRLVGCPLLLEVNAPLCHERSKFGGLSLTSLARWTENYAWRKADAVLPVTEVLAGMVIGTNTDPSIVHVVHNGVHLSKFDNLATRDEARQKLALTATVTFGFVGYLRDWHRLDSILNILAMPDFQDSSLVILGDGTAMPELKCKAIELKLLDRIVFAGLVSRADILDYMAAFDIALQPSVVPYASPLKLFEYMAMGLPIIAPDTRNIREVLTNERDALLVSDNAADPLRDAMLRLAQDGKLRSRLGNAARQTLENGDFTWAGNAGRVASIAADIIEGSK